MKNWKHIPAKMSLVKNLILSLGISVATMSVSCSKDDEAEQPAPVVYAEENPLAKYYETTGFTTSSDFINAGDYEFGLAFTPKVKGKINALVVKLPAVNSNLRVTVWDYATKTVIRSETVNVGSANTEIVKSIPELVLEKDKMYFISMNSNDWYKKNKPDNSNTVYPVTAGNIVFSEYRWVSGTAQNWPTNVSSNYNAGDLSFKFQQID
ncbi:MULTISPECIES: DUF4082 domain-containing protein [Chryseobacterium]|uniref:Uncharacterized protein n=1 Tax=Chryseobacterium taihuense TaxID=1141221 RepID=A0A4U8W800_9FLAO|nr:MULTISPECIES: DUF4082 domain-containing protein [Chryseobacterium]QQV04255.1 DUF4082 domain-containing protein [Chryseobacterium sp. FDAARGOS 1104]VFB02377.1 Uncharacterised protein [Chryseobacterium taihuense]